MGNEEGFTLAQKGEFKSNREEYLSEEDAIQQIRNDPWCMLMAGFIFGLGLSMKGEEPMWSKMIAMMPIAALMSTVTIPEEIKMEGDLQDELERILGKYMQPMKLLRNKEIDCRIDTSYPEQSNLWTIFDGILQRYRLNSVIEPLDGTIGVRLEKASAWAREGYV